MKHRRKKSDCEITLKKNYMKKTNALENMMVILYINH